MEILKRIVDNWEKKQKIELEQQNRVRQYNDIANILWDILYNDVMRNRRELLEMQQEPF